MTKINVGQWVQLPNKSVARVEWTNSFNVRVEDFWNQGLSDARRTYSRLQVQPVSPNWRQALWANVLAGGAR